MSEQPTIGDCYYDINQKVWTAVAFWKHPRHQSYHVGWTGDYVILQEYGNYKNELQFVKLEDWPRQFTLAWTELRVCQFCGFSRMVPCKVRQSCPNLSDYRLEPDEPCHPEGDE